MRRMTCVVALATSVLAMGGCSKKGEGGTAEAAKGKPAGPTLKVKIDDQDFGSQAIDAAMAGVDKYSKGNTIHLFVGCPGLTAACDQVQNFDVRSMMDLVKAKCPNGHIVTVGLKLADDSATPKWKAGKLDGTNPQAKAYVQLSSADCGTGKCDQLWDLPSMGEITSVSPTEIKGTVKAATANSKTSVEGPFTAKVCSPESI